MARFVLAGKRAAAAAAWTKPASTPPAVQRLADLKARIVDKGAEITDTSAVCRLTAIRQATSRKLHTWTRQPPTSVGTPPALRHPPGADVDPSAGGDAHGATQDHAEPPVRHLVIFSRLSRPSALRP